MSDPIDRNVLERNQIAQAALISVVAIVRIGTGLWHGKRLVLEDVWLILCWAFAFAADIMYIYVLRAYFRTADVGAGITEPYATIMDDAAFIQKVIFAITICYWSCLWAAKLALLFLSKKLMTHLPHYMRLWYALLGLCIATWVACLVTLFTACSSMEAWFTAGMCQTPRDITAANISRYFSFSTDVLTNILIMLLPLKLIISLQMPMSRKISISGLFTLAWVCIIAAILRCAQIGEANAAPTFPWLALWGTIETTIAVVVCAGPGLYRAVKMTKESRRGYYENSSSKAPTGGPYSAANRTNRSRNVPAGENDDDVRLKRYPGSTNITALDLDNSSEEVLVESHHGAGIKVTQTTQVDFGPGRAQ